jgi:hypothetical protein
MIRGEAGRERRHQVAGDGRRGYVRPRPEGSTFVDPKRLVDERGRIDRARLGRADVGLIDGLHFAAEDQIVVVERAEADQDGFPTGRRRVKRHARGVR